MTIWRQRHVAKSSSLFPEQSQLCPGHRSANGPGHARLTRAHEVRRTETTASRGHLRGRRQICTVKREPGNLAMLCHRNSAFSKRRSLRRPTAASLYGVAVRQAVRDVQCAACSWPPCRIPPQSTLVLWLACLLAGGCVDPSTAFTTYRWRPMLPLVTTAAGKGAAGLKWRRPLPGPLPL